MGYMETALTAWLQRYRKDKGWTVRQMAGRVHIPPSTFDQIINGKVEKPDPASLRTIAEYTGVSIDRLLAMAGHRPADAPTGDPEIDALIAVAMQMPPERRRSYVQEMLRLARLIERLPEDAVPDVGPTPASGESSDTTPD